jgi:lipopolysaccharide transport protein LptA
MGPRAWVPGAGKLMLAAVGLFAFVAASAQRSPSPTQPGFHNVGGFDTITTRTIDTNLNTGDFTVPERFAATRSGTEISADRATGNSKKKLVHATGHVVVHRTGQVESQGELASKVSGEPSTLTCDTLDVDGIRKFYVAVGNVHFTQQDREATADRATLNDLTNELHLTGNVHIRDKEQFLDGNDVIYNTKTGDVKATGNPVMVRTPVEAATPGGLAPPAASPSPQPKRKG